MRELHDPTVHINYYNSQYSTLAPCSNYNLNTHGSFFYAWMSYPRDLETIIALATMTFMVEASLYELYLQVTPNG